MSGYFSGSNVQADAMQTLYLMDPSYSAFNDSSNNSNMVLISPNTGAENQGNRFDIVGHRQQQHTGLSTLGSSGIAQQSHVVSLSNSGMSHQNPSLSVFTGRVNEAGYSWNGGNEFSFLPSSDMAEDNQSLAARLGVVTAVHQPGNDVNHYGVRGLSHPSIQEQGSLIPSGVALDVESLQASSGAGQILSLSLSPQQSAVAHLQSLPMQHHEPAVNDSPGFSNVGTNNIITKGESFINKCVGDLNAFRSSPSGNLLGTGLQNQLSAVSHRQLNMVSSASTLELYSSKYLKAAQQLLNEVVSVGRGIKQRSLNQSKIASWMEPGSASEGFLAKDKNLPETSGKDGVTVSWSGTKDGPTAVSSMAAGSTGHTEPHAENAVELTLAERQELQMKKTKLMAMLDEVDRRYQQYYHQMQIVVGSFESAAGLGAARTYTALALQTISKHFRCLKDAIRGQIRATCKSLGEEDALGQGRGDRSRLRFIDQQLRQQRAFQQLGMMQQPAWRPQRGLPERSVSILRAWLFEHFLHPYPKDSDKHLLASQTGLTRNQVSNWFINARVRLWKPMVEEMYAEEIKEGDGEDLDKVADDEDDMSKGNSLKDIAGNSEASKGTQQANMQDAHLEQYSDPQLLSEHSSDMLHNRNLTSNLAESFSFQEKESTSQGMKRARNDTQDSISVLSSYSSGGMEFKPGEEIQDMKVRMDNRHMENYNMPHNALPQVNHQSFGGYGSLHLNGLSRYPHEGLAGSYTANSGVSLTLGLQHSDGLSLTSAQQHYMQGQGQVQMVRREEGAVAPASFYAMNESNAAGHNNIYAALDSKRYGAHLLHDLA